MVSSWCFGGAILLALVQRSASTPTRNVDPRNAWYHVDDHPVNALFRRQQNTTQPPAVGSPEWTARYPAAFPPKTIPAEWTQRLAQVVAAGLIPNISLSTQANAGADPTYPNGQSPTSAAICSATYDCRGAGDVWDAPAGLVGLSFDDGPLPPSPTLYNFLKSNNQHATHFFIGINILQNPKIFLQAFQDNQDDIAIHTYTHPYMTTKTNEEVVAELGWTAQIIHDSTGGRVPKYWRPPYGDVDNRVRAIATHVFGLTTVIWNQDSEDWQITATTNAITLATVEASLTKFYQLPKSPGLVILEHELSNESVQAFIYSWPLIKAGNWTLKTIPDVAGDPNKAWYQNSLNDTAVVVPFSVGLGGTTALSVSTTSSSPSPTSASTKASGTTSAGPLGTVSAHGAQTSNASIRKSDASMLSLGAGAVFAFICSLL